MGVYLVLVNVTYASEQGDHIVNETKSQFFFLNFFSKSECWIDSDWNLPNIQEAMQRKVVASTATTKALEEAIANEFIKVTNALNL